MSHWHVVNSFEKAKSNYPCLISKATQGTTYKDPTLVSFIKGCEAQNIPYWLYTFMAKGGEVNQAKYLVDTCKSLVGDNFVGYILDVEKKNNADSVKNALTYLSKNCDKCILYTGYADYKLYASVISSLPSNCKWREARYGNNIGSYNAKYSCHYGAFLHQYTSNASLVGISGRCDASRLVSEANISWMIDSKETATKTVSCPYSAPTSVVKYGSMGDAVKNIEPV